MQGTRVKTSVELEREELDAVAAYLERTPRMAKLLHFLAQKYFEGDTKYLTEYNIAIEVFDRNKADFVTSQDAIARVETHRLRKRLKAYYEGDGKEHAIQIKIPPGTYVPVFAACAQWDQSSQQPTESDDVLRPGGDPALSSEDLEDTPDSGAAGPIAVEPGDNLFSHPKLPRRVWLYVLITAALVIAVLGITLAVRSRGVATANPSVSAAVPSRPASETATRPSVALPFRMIAGYTGPPQTDSAGQVWQSDQYFNEGWAVTQPAVFIERTSDPLIFRYGRAGDHSYNIPLKPGVYELHLYFFQPSDTSQSEDAENKAIFNVSVNGEVALFEFDIVSDAMGRNVADERVLRDVSPAPDGMLHLHLSTVLGTPSLSAIELLPGTPHKQLPIRVVALPTAYTDHDGRWWHPDSYFQGGRHLSHNIPVKESVDTELLSAERYGHFTYAFPVDTRDQYTVVLHFVELFFGTEEAGASGKGNRVFRVMCNGNTLLDDFNIYKEAGNRHMLTKTFYHLKPTAQGKLNLTFEPMSNYATVSAIEVIDEHE